VVDGDRPRRGHRPRSSRAQHGDKYAKAAARRLKAGGRAAAQLLQRPSRTTPFNQPARQRFSRPATSSMDTGAPAALLPALCIVAEAASWHTCMRAGRMSSHTPARSHFHAFISLPQARLQRIACVPHVLRAGRCAPPLLRARVPPHSLAQEQPSLQARLQAIAEVRVLQGAAGGRTLEPWCVAGAGDGGGCPRGSELPPAPRACRRCSSERAGKLVRYRRGVRWAPGSCMSAC